MIVLDLRAGDEHGSVRMKLALGGSIGAFRVALRGTQYENRFLPRRAPAPRSWRVVLRIESGALQLAGRTLHRGDWAIARDTVFVPETDGPPIAAAVRGDVELFAVRLGVDCFSSLAPLEIVHASSAVERAYCGVAAELDTASAPTAALVDGLRALLGAIHEGGWAVRVPSLPDGAPDPMVLRVQQALTTGFARLREHPMMLDLIERAGITERQMLRDLIAVQERLGMFRGGWRDTLRWWRVTAAMFLLGHPARSVDSVARATGYADASALGRAFRDSGLPSPARVRDELSALG